MYESTWLLDDANLERLALEEARVIAECFGVEKERKIYRVQVGAYFLKANATKLALRLEAKGIPVLHCKVRLLLQGSGRSIFHKRKRHKDVE